MTTITGYAVAKKREEMGISQAHLAQQLGISADALDRIEKDRLFDLKDDLYNKLRQFVTGEADRLDQIIARLDKLDERVNEILELAEKVLRGR